jgi:hypothetical protein
MAYEISICLVLESLLLATYHAKSKKVGRDTSFDAPSFTCGFN